MKNIRILYYPDEIHHHFHQKWKTDLFRWEHNKVGSFIHAIMSRVAEYPLFIYDMSDHPEVVVSLREKTEWKHFSPWWGGIIDYHFESPGIHDTCWLHDLHHKGFTAYLPNLSLDIFREKMLQQEVRTTIATVFEIYFHYPELRPHTYEEEILTDRYLNDTGFMTAWRQNPYTKREELVLKLREISLQPDPGDPIKRQIYEYSRKNEAWLKIWSKRYNLIESAMHALQGNIQSGMDRKEAMDRHMAWLTSDAITNGSEIPFPDEAIAFAEIYGAAI